MQSLRAHDPIFFGHSMARFDLTLQKACAYDASPTAARHQIFHWDLGKSADYEVDYRVFLSESGSQGYSCSVFAQAWGSKNWLDAVNTR